MSSPRAVLEPTTSLAPHGGLSSQTAIFMNGPALTGKTTLAGHLGRCLGIPVLGTHEHGTVLTNGTLDTSKRLARYPLLLARAHGALAAGWSVVLDASFLDYTRRSPLYALARRFGTRLIAIRTSCDDLELIRARARRRAGDPTAPDHGVGVEAYLLTRDEVLASPLENDAEFGELGVEVVEFHTGRDAYVACEAGADADARMIASILEGSGLLFSSPRCVVAGGRRP